MISFFKVVYGDDFTRLLRLPQVFMRQYEPILPREVKLRIESVKTWDVKVKAMKEKDGLFCFSKGWDVFARDVGLKFGEFITFVLDDDGYTFDAYVYRKNGCIKEFPESSSDVSSEDDDYEDNDSSDSDGGKRPVKVMNPLYYYEIVLKPHSRYRLTLKRKFARAAGLMGKETVEVVGEHHKMCVALDNTHRDKNRIDLAQGWTDFLTVNGFVYGNTYSLEFKPNKNVIQIKEVN